MADYPTTQVDPAASHPAGHDASVLWRPSPVIADGHFLEWTVHACRADLHKTVGAPVGHSS